MSLDHADKMRFVTRLSAGGVLAAVVLAKVGRLPFDLPMPTHAVGWVEPTCGMTRGVTAIAIGKFHLAWRFNPASYLVAGVGFLGVVRSIVGISTRRWINVAIRLDVRRSVILTAALATLWAYQQTHADFVITVVSDPRPQPRMLPLSAAVAPSRARDRSTQTQATVSVAWTARDFSYIMS